jgi:hypothetical protein
VSETVKTPRKTVLRRLFVVHEVGLFLTRLSREASRGRSAPIVPLLRVIIRKEPKEYWKQHSAATGRMPNSSNSTTCFTRIPPREWRPGKGNHTGHDEAKSATASRCPVGEYPNETTSKSNSPRRLRGRQGLRHWNQCEKVVSRALGGIFSGGWASKMEIPVNGRSTDGLEVCHEEGDSSAYLHGNLHLLSGRGAGQIKAGGGRIKKA